MKNMKKMKLYAVISPLCILFAQSALTVQAQKIDDSQLRLAGGKILIDSVLTQKKSDSLKVAFRLHLDSLQLKSEQQLVFTPLIAGEDTIALNPIIINGKNQNIRYLRKSSKLKNSQAVVVRRKNDTEQQVLFSQTLPYRKWMKAFNLSMTEDLCGCGDLMDQDTTQMAVINPIPKIGRDHYVKPKAEAIKVRAEKGEAYLSFKLNKSDILADFRENASELRKITSTIDLVKNDKDVSITNIDIHGYASPDGPYANNVRLANNRAAALRNYVCNLYTIDKKLFTYHTTPEDWEGFKKKVEASNLADKSAILAVANSSLAPDAKDQKIKKLYPASYRYIMSEIYPRLRHSDYTVTYTVRPFDIEEAKVILKTKPQQLSLQEMYLVAQTYEPGSPEFNEVFDIAVRLFPDDETANLNAACTDLQKGDLVTAEKHLAKAGNSKEAERIRKIYGEMKAEQ